MTDNIVPINSSQSPFDAIRSFDGKGREFWFATEILDMLDMDYLMPEKDKWERDGFRLKTAKPILTREDLGLLLLELSSIFAMQNSMGYVRDALYIHSLASSIYDGQSATAMFHAVFSQAFNKIDSLLNESIFHQYIQLFWQEIFPFATKIDHEYRISSQSTVDFLLDDCIPVEVKKDQVNRQDMNQLSRYMEELSAPKGYLIAPKSLVRIPSNVVFVQITFDEIHKKMLSSHVPVKDKLNIRIRQRFIGE